LVCEGKPVYNRRMSISQCGKKEKGGGKNTTDIGPTPKQTDQGTERGVRRKRTKEKK